MISSTSSQPWRKVAFHLLSAVYLLLIFGGPALAVCVLYRSLDSDRTQLIVAFAAPLLYAAGFLLMSGGLSIYHQKGIIVGRFPRDTQHPVYFHRRLYGLCWASMYYCKPAYALCLSVPVLKWAMFRLFGYRNGMNFTVYPDTWIRDLPLLRFGEGVYVSNRATLGTNIALASGHILVDRIELEQGSLIGHLTMLAPGVRVGRRAEIAVGCAIGIGAEIGERAKVLPTCTIEHGVRIHPRAVVGTMSYVGNKSIIAEGVHLAPGSLVTRRSAINSQQDAMCHISSAARAATVAFQSENTNVE